MQQPELTILGARLSCLWRVAGGNPPYGVTRGGVSVVVAPILLDGRRGFSAQVRIEDLGFSYDTPIKDAPEDSCKDAEEVILKLAGFMKGRKWLR